MDNLLIIMSGWQASLLALYIFGFVMAFPLALSIEIKQEPSKLKAVRNAICWGALSLLYFLCVDWEKVPPTIQKLRQKASIAFLGTFLMGAMISCSTNRYNTLDYIDSTQKCDLLQENDSTFLFIYYNKHKSGTFKIVIRSKDELDWSVI